MPGRGTRKAGTDTITRPPLGALAAVSCTQTTALCTRSHGNNGHFHEVDESDGRREDRGHHSSLTFGFMGRD